MENNEVVVLPGVCGVVVTVVVAVVSPRTDCALVDEVEDAPGGRVGENPVAASGGVVTGPLVGTLAFESTVERIGEVTMGGLVVGLAEERVDVVAGCPELEEPGFGVVEPGVLAVRGVGVATGGTVEALLGRETALDEAAAVTARDGEEGLGLGVGRAVGVSDVRELGASIREDEGGFAVKVLVRADGLAFEAIAIEDMAEGAGAEETAVLAVLAVDALGSEEEVPRTEGADVSDVDALNDDDVKVDVSAVGEEKFGARLELGLALAETKRVRVVVPWAERVEAATVPAPVLDAGDPAPGAEEPGLGLGVGIGARLVLNTEVEETREVVDATTEAGLITEADDGEGLGVEMGVGLGVKVLLLVLGLVLGLVTDPVEGVGVGAGASVLLSGSVAAGDAVTEAGPFIDADVDCDQELGMEGLGVKVMLLILVVVLPTLLVALVPVEREGAGVGAGAKVAFAGIAV